MNAAAKPPAGIERFADRTQPARVRFEGGASHTGTSRPEILQDGEGIVRHYELSPFEVETTIVTNARFAAFVLDTGYATVAERFGWGTVFYGLLENPEAYLEGAGNTPWWCVVKGACWHAPEGPGSSVEERTDHPVTHIAWEDAQAFAEWAGGRLPSEAEWEHAARGGLDDPRFVWGDREPDDNEFLPCNIFQGHFPDVNTAADGWLGTSPVKAFAPNNAGLYDMAGNVWEWTNEPFVIQSAGRNAQMRNSQAQHNNEKLMKGGSFLCHVTYCYRYRIAARLATAADSGGCNSGMRIFYDG